MPVNYTNRKGVTFYLCQGVTKTGKTRHYFSRQPKGEPVEEIPAGYAIRESVNGVVSLAKSEPQLIEPREVDAVEQAVQRHPKAQNYRVRVKRNMIEVYERVGPDTDDLLQIFAKNGLGTGIRDRIEQDLEQHSRFEPVLRLILVNTQERTFSVERMGYSGRGGWLDVYDWGKIEPLARNGTPSAASAPTSSLPGMEYPIMFVSIWQFPMQLEQDLI